MKKLCFNQIPSKLYIFGAGRVAQAVVLTLMCLKVEICGIVVTNKRRNYNDIEGIKVYSLEEYKAVKDETSLVLAVREQYINEIYVKKNPWEFLYNKGNYKWVIIAEDER